MGLVLDSGALTAFERGDRDVAALVEAARRRRDRIVTSSGCVAQVWRGVGSRQALLSRLLRGVGEDGLDQEVSRTVGGVCGTAGISDVIDGHVSLLARDGDMVLTSDPAAIRALVRARRCNAQVRRC